MRLVVGFFCLGRAMVNVSALRVEFKCEVDCVVEC